MKIKMIVATVGLLLPLLGQAQGDFNGTLYLDNEVPEVMVKDQRHNMDLIRVNTATVKAYDQDGLLIPLDRLRDGDPISYKYNAYTQRLELWVDLVALERTED